MAKGEKMRLIDGDDLLTAFPYDDEPTVTKSCVRMTIKHMPIIDAEPIRHGRWKGKPIAGYSTVKCSECEYVFMENSGKWNYCPHCGTKMDEEINENETC